MLGGVPGASIRFPESLEDDPDQIGRCMVLGVAADCSAATVGLHDRPLRDGFDRVVGPFGMNVGFERFENRRHRLTVEKTDSIHHPQMGNGLYPLCFGNDGSEIALASADGGIGVHRCYQVVAESARSREVAEVTDVEDVKRAVDEDYGLSLIAPAAALLGQLIDRAQLGRGFKHR